MLPTNFPAIDDRTSEAVQRRIRDVKRQRQVTLSDDRFNELAYGTTKASGAPSNLSTSISVLLVQPMQINGRPLFCRALVHLVALLRQ